MSSVKIPDYPSNNGKEEKETIKPIASGVRKKKKLMTSLKETFLEGNKEQVTAYVLNDIIVPIFKKGLSDTVTGAIDILLNGSTSGRRTNPNQTIYRGGGSSFINYAAPTQPYSSRQQNRRDNVVNRKGASDIVLATRSDAENVLSTLVDICQQYDTCSQAELFQLVGLDSVYTDEAWGWDDLQSAYIQRERDGYLLVLPTPIYIK